LFLVSWCANLSEKNAQKLPKISSQNTQNVRKIFPKKSSLFAGETTLGRSKYQPAVPIIAEHNHIKLV